MQINASSSAIGVIPKPEARGTERRRAGREVFGETIARSERQLDRPDDRRVAVAPAA
jgi:hypothetical protein